MKRIPWNTIWQRVMRLPFLAAEHALLSTLLLVAVAGVFSLIIFAYGFSVQTKHAEQGTSLYDVHEELFLDVVAELKRRELNLENAGKEVPGDIFNSVD